MKNLRKHLRTETQKPIEVKITPGDEIMGMLMDYSNGGFKLLSRTPYPSEQKFNVSLASAIYTNSGYTIQCACQCRWSGELNEGFYHIGFEICAEQSTYQ